MKNLTLKEIAKQAGVSRSTASRVVNDQPRVSPEAREKVLAVIKETGYQPNAAARSLRSQRSSIIGLVIPRSLHLLFSDPYFPRFTQGVAQACNRHDYTLALYIESEEQALIPRITRKGHLDGLIVQVAAMDSSLIDDLHKANIPFVAAGRPMDTQRTSFVDVDNIEGGRLATDHLIQLGHQRIATITGDLNSTAGTDRLKGYQRALKSGQLPYEEQLSVSGGFSEEGGYQAARQLLPHKPEAIFVASDVMARGAIRAIQEANLSVPEDIALVGYDDLPPAVLAQPRLTTVHQPVVQLGVQAMKLLLEIMTNDLTSPRQVIMDVELVVRESSKVEAPAPA